MAVEWRHAGLGFRIHLPDGSEVREDPEPGIALIAVEPHPRGPFRANLVVTVEELSGTFHDAEAYTDASIADQEQALSAFRLVDREARDGRTRTLGHHDVDGVPVVVDQWRAVAGDLGYTVTASCWALEYDELADAFAAAAESLEP
jgi:hypothetical protein